MMIDNVDVVSISNLTPHMVVPKSHFSSNVKCTSTLIYLAFMFIFNKEQFTSFGNGMLPNSFLKFNLICESHAYLKPRYISIRIVEFISDSYQWGINNTIKDIF